MESDEGHDHGLTPSGAWRLAPPSPCLPALGASFGHCRRCQRRWTTRCVFYTDPGRQLLPRRCSPVDRSRPVPDDLRLRSLNPRTTRRRSRKLERSRAGYEPPLQERVADIARSVGLVVSLGFPVWGTTAPSIVRRACPSAMFRQNLVPFITRGGYGPGSSQEDDAQHAPRARLMTASSGNVTRSGGP